MWKIQKVTEAHAVVLCISGRIGSDELQELRKLVSLEEAAFQPVELDLQNVRLVSQPVIIYLAEREAKGSTLRNCPPYIREWIERERTIGSAGSNGDH